MKKNIKKISIQTIGYLFLLIGVAGIILPVLNGTIFLIVGLLLLSLHSPWAKSLLHKAGKKSVQVEKVIVKMEKLVLKYVGDL